jgi:hypothetical protein
MEKCIMKKYLRLGTLAILSASTPFIAHADTLTLEATSGVLNPSGTAYIYPYSFSVNGSSTSTEMMCMDDNREVTTGESWQADPSAVTKNSSKTDQIAADIFSRIGKGGVTDDDAQEAIWSLFDSADQKTAEDKKLIREAMEDIRDGNTGAFDDAQYTIYTAENGTQSEGGIPQDFIGPTDPNSVAPPAPVPEPSTLLLMGSGLISIAGTVRRRFRV